MRAAILDKVEALAADVEAIRGEWARSTWRT